VSEGGIGLSDLYLAADNAVSTLDGAINALVVSLDVDDATNFPATGNFPIVVWDAENHAYPTEQDEQMLVTAVSGDTFTVTRGIQSTTPVAHSDHESVAVKVCKAYFDQIETVVGEKVAKAGDDMTGALNMDTDAAGVTFGDGQDASILYDGSNLKVDPAVVGSGAVRIGGDTHYLQIAADGQITLVGNARIKRDIWIPAQGIRAPGVKGATFVDLGISGVWEFSDGQEEQIICNIQLPHGFDAGEDLTFNLGWSSPAQSLNCDWEVAYLLTAIGDDTSAAADGTLQGYKTSAATANGLVMSPFTVPAAGVGATDVCVHVKIMRDGNDASDTLGAAAHIHGVCLEVVVTNFDESI